MATEGHRANKLILEMSPFTLQSDDPVHTPEGHHGQLPQNARKPFPLSCSPIYQAEVTVHPAHLLPTHACGPFRCTKGPGDHRCSQNLTPPMIAAMTIGISLTITCHADSPDNGDRRSFSLQSRGNVLPRTSLTIYLGLSFAFHLSRMVRLNCAGLPF